MLDHVREKINAILKDDDIKKEYYVQIHTYIQRFQDLLKNCGFDKDGCIPEDSFPSEASQVFELMCSTAGMAHFYYLVCDFFNENAGWEINAIKEKIKSIEAFISYAETLSTLDANKAYGKKEQDNLIEFAYLRIKNGFYDKIYLNFINFSSDETVAYATYFLFYEFLKERVRKIEPSAALNLKNCFKLPSKYYEVLTILNRHNIIDQNEMNWLRAEGGRKAQLNTFICTLDKLQLINYLTYEQKATVIKETFNEVISPRTLKEPLNKLYSDYYEKLLKPLKENI
jgi:hypothetical protein